MTITVYWESGETEEYLNVSYYEIVGDEVRISGDDGISWILNFSKILKIKKVVL